MIRNILLLLCVCAVGCTTPKSPRADHVILIGLDAMGAYGLQRAQTPTLNYLIEQGAVSINTRCVRPTSSSQNWMSMVSGALPLQHGVLDNDWERDNIVIEPSSTNRIGLFPTIFDNIRTQRPDAKIYMFYEWTEQDRMYDLSVADKAVSGLDSQTTMRRAFDAFFTDKPDFLFVSVDEPDHTGHEYGHESQEYLQKISSLDALIGELVARLEKEGMTDNTVLIVTADHGGVGPSHGGDSRYERIVPMIFFGKGVTPGKVILESLLICDVAASIAGLLGVELPRECVGRFVREAFTPNDNNEIYVPIPFITPSGGFFREPATVAITGDVKGAEIYYTLDGSLPDAGSIRYEQPLLLDSSALLRAVVCRDGHFGLVADANIRIMRPGESPKVSYKYWPGITGEKLPDFATLGRPARTGRVCEFSLDELGVDAEDHFAVEFSARLVVEYPGRYKFGAVSDDGSRVYLDGQLVVNNDGSHAADVKYGFVELTAGLHDLKVTYFDDNMGQHLELYYASDSIPLQVVPQTSLR